MVSRRKSAPPPRVEPVGTKILWYIAAGVCVWSFGYTSMRGSDLWWHIAGGRWMVENGTLWVADPFSFTAAGEPWLNDSWLSDVLLYFWSEGLGLKTLSYWKWALMIATWLVLLRVTWRLSGDAASSFLALLLGLGIAEPFLDVRPQLYSFLGWALLLNLCLRDERPPRWLPLLYLVWVNLHAGFLLGFISLPLVLAPHYLKADAAGRREVLWLGVACVAACLINPNGLEVVVRPLRYAFDSSSPFRTLGEWLPPFRRGGIQSPLLPYGIAAFVGAAAVWIWELWRGARRPHTAVPLVLAALTLAMALRSRRFVPFFAMTQVLVLAPVLAQLLAEPLRRLPAYAAPAAALAASLWWMSPMPLRSYAFDRLTAYSEFPIDTCEFINANQFSGKVFAYYNWGGFVHLCTHGRLKVFIDGRADMLYSDQTFRSYLVVINEEPGWERMVERSAADFVLWPLRQSSVPLKLAKSGKWRVIYQDVVSMLLARSDLELPADLKNPPDSPYRQMTLALRELQAGRAREAATRFEDALVVDPYFMPACVGLCRSQAVGGDYAAAHATVDRCNRIMPDASQAAHLHAFIDRLRAQAAAKARRGE